jgi:hypothetical protein
VDLFGVVPSSRLGTNPRRAIARQRSRPAGFPEQCERTAQRQQATSFKIVTQDEEIHETVELLAFARPLSLLYQFYDSLGDVPLQWFHYDFL